MKPCVSERLVVHSGGIRLRKGSICGCGDILKILVRALQIWAPGKIQSGERTQVGRERSEGWREGVRSRGDVGRVAGIEQVTLLEHLLNHRPRVRVAGALHDAQHVRDDPVLVHAVVAVRAEGLHRPLHRGGFRGADPRLEGELTRAKHHARHPLGHWHARVRLRGEDLWLEHARMGVSGEADEGV
eukprot:gene10975-biopygen12379